MTNHADLHHLSLAMTNASNSHRELDLLVSSENKVVSSMATSAIADIARLEERLLRMHQLIEKELNEQTPGDSRKLLSPIRRM